MHQIKNVSGVSVVICTHRGSKTIQETLSCLMQQTVGEMFPWEVILVDNASTDGTVEIARQHWDCRVPLRVVSEPRLGVGYARSTGLREAAHEFVAFVDDDNLLAANWIETAQEKMVAHPDAGAIGGYNLARPEIIPPAWFARYQACYAVGGQAPDEGEIRDERLVLWAAGMAVRKTAWQELQHAGFEPLLYSRRGQRLDSGEDSELCYLLRIFGWKLYYFSVLQLTHIIPAEKLQWSYLCRLQRGFGRASVYLLMYRRILHYLLTGERSRPASWQKELLAESLRVLGQPGALGATLLNLYEGNYHVVRMHASLGRVARLAHLLGEKDRIEARLWAKYGDAADRKLAY